MKITISDLTDTTFVGSRHAGEQIRKKIKEALDRNERIILDFQGVSNITQGFADEAIGILIRAFGTDIINHIKIVNANEKIRLILNWVANYSKKEHPSAGGTA